MTCTLLTLPRELQLLVFNHQSRAIDALSLSSTCKTLYSLWRSSYHHITSAILSQEILCYPQALQLANAQAEFSPSLLRTNSDKAREYFKVSSCTPAAEIAKTAQAYDKDLVDALAKYEEWIPLLGPPHPLTDMDKLPYIAHLRHLRLIYRNARDAALVAECFFDRHVQDARTSPPDWVMEDGGIPCDIHIKRAALPHERARATDCFYFFRLSLLGHFKPEIHAQCLEALKTMPLMKFYALDIFAHMINSTDVNESREIRRILGLQRDPLSSHDAETYFTEESQSILRLLEKVLLQRTSRFPYSSYGGVTNIVYGPCDMCFAGSHGRYCINRAKDEDPWFFDSRYAHAVGV